MFQNFTKGRARGTRHGSWFRHYATTRKIEGSIPDDVIGFFNLPNPSSRTTILGWTQPLTEMSFTPLGHAAINRGLTMKGK
jgi:hypothetical protein